MSKEAVWGLDEGKRGLGEDVELVWAWRMRRGQKHQRKDRVRSNGNPLSAPREGGEALCLQITVRRRRGGAGAAEVGCKVGC